MNQSDPQHAQPDPHYAQPHAPHDPQQDPYAGADPHLIHSSEEIAHHNLAEAEALRRKREKAGKMSAVMMTVLIHAVAILVLALWVLPAMKMDVPEITATALPPTESNMDSPKVNQQTLKPKPASPSASAKLLTSLSPTAQVFVPQNPVETTVADIGMGTGLGMGFGGDGFGGGGLPGLPGAMKGRCTPQERLKRLREGGGTEECEEAVVRALRWLQQKQNENGSWGQSYPAAMTGFALLAYLGHCETPRSKEFGETVTRGITFLVNLASSSNGTMGAGGREGYQHAIATYALCEALTFCKELKMDFPGLEATCEKAIGIIVDGQSKNGSWNYTYKREGGDLSIAGWNIQALKAAYHAGFDNIKVRDAAKKAVERVKNQQAPSGTFGYRGKEDLGQRLVGVGTLSLQMWGEESSREARAGLRWMRKNMDPVYTGGSCNLYAWYYATLSLFQRGGSYWSGWNRKWRDEMLNNQKKDGSWKKEGGKTHGAGRDTEIYRTCLNTLSLEVYYRFLPGTG